VIHAKRQTVYYVAPARRHNQSLGAASYALARHLIEKKFPTQKGDETDGFHFWSLERDEPVRYARLKKRLARILRRQFRAATNPQSRFPE